MLKMLKYFILLAWLLVLLQACSNNQQNNQNRGADNASRTAGLYQYHQQNYYAATQELMSVWQQDPQDHEVMVALMDSWLQLDEETRVWQMLNQTAMVKDEVAIMVGELSQRNGQCENALQSLQQVGIESIPVQWQQRHWQLQASCAAQLNEHLDAAVAWIKLSALITETDTATAEVGNNPVLDIHRNIVENLIRVSDENLRTALANLDHEAITLGWLEAAYVNFGADGVSGDDWLERWQDHPASAFFLNSQNISNRQKVAVLLPLSGRFQAVAKAFQTGMLTAAAAEYVEANELIFFDTGSQGENLSAAWYSAQEQAVDMIIGPLDKTSIEMIEAMPAATMPVILLNQSEAPYHQFTLSPEGEAEQAAEKMYRDGHRQVLIMAVNEPWGERLTKAFAQKFVDLGGDVINNAYFLESQNDYSSQLRQILGLVESQLRAKNLQSFLKINLDAEVVVRPDVDAIFLAARPSFARLMIPQLKFHHASQIPVYSTSHVFEGLNNTQHNRDLQGVRFAISPIELQADRLTELLPFDLDAVRHDNKLFAFGYDTYHLIDRLEWMSQVNFGSINGLTGRVNMDFDGRFYRGLLWAQYDNGSVHALSP